MSKTTHYVTLMLHSVVFRMLLQTVWAWVFPTFWNSFGRNLFKQNRAFYHRFSMKRLNTGVFKNESWYPSTGMLKGNGPFFDDLCKLISLSFGRADQLQRQPFHFMFLARNSFLHTLKLNKQQKRLFCQK